MEGLFNAATLDIYRQAKEQCHYTATRFLNMVVSRGGVETAKTLLATDVPSEGYVRLWECGRLDLTVEALVLEEQYASLFTVEELARAKARLKEYGYPAG
jgi:hypothetical protein